MIAESVTHADETDQGDLVEQKRKYVYILANTSIVISRRTSGTYSFGYAEMNSILRSAHAEKQNRTTVEDAEKQSQESSAVVRVSTFYFQIYSHAVGS
jgi:hypothetical protein